MATNTTQAKSNWDDKELGCLWRREKQATKEKYLTGVLDAKKVEKVLAENGGADIQLVVFTNKGKQKDTHPDLRIYLSEKKPAASPVAKGAAPAKAVAPPAPAPVPDASELI